MKQAIAVVWMIAMLALAGRALAHEGHEHKMMGTVTAVDATHLDMESKDGGKLSVLLNKETKCFKGDAPAAVSDIKVGDRVVVSAVEQGKEMLAREVRMAAASGVRNP